MDDIQLVRQIFGRPTPPTAAEIAVARGRLGLPTSTKSASRRHTRWAVSGVGLVAAAAAAALVAASLGGTSHSPPQASGARRILLAAAEQATHGPSTGRYWHTHITDTTNGQYLRKGRKRIFDPTVIHGGTDNWLAPSNGLDDVRYAQNSKIATLTDAQLRKDEMKRVGSWVEQRTTSGQKLANVKICQVKRCGPLTLAQSTALASDPKRLATTMFWTRRTSPTQDLRDAFAFLTGNPLPPATQAAAFRVLADLPRVRSEGPVTLDGRSGTAIGAIEGGAYSYQLVFDKADRLIGSRELTGKTVTATDSIVTNGWTNADPQPPA